ncbi:MAG TPA: DUF4184 family protein [Burkholderiales bacterium]|nr:DUF4184 family protein [Burkholderiales bacterium]
MPYPFAHPAAILPLVRPLGPLAVPSALVIGSVVPDAWYFFSPLLQREHTHGLAGLFLFCLPAGVAAYFAFHLLLKQPLLELAPPPLAARLARYAAPGLPRVRWSAVLVCLLAGASTHLAWDALAHLHSLAQHASTLLGSAVLAVWIWRKLSRTPPAPLSAPALSEPQRAAVVAALLAVAAASAWWAGTHASVELVPDLEALRRTARITGLAAAQALGAGLIAYSGARTALRGRSRAPRSPAGR